MENPNIDTQISNLQNRAIRLHYDARNEDHPMRKKAFIDQKAEIVSQIAILTHKRDLERESQSIGRINDVFKTTDRIIIVKVNGITVKPDQDLNITLRFSCGHTRKIHVSEMLSYQKSCPNKQVLLSRWQAILNHDTTLTTSFSCEQCRKAKSKKFNLFRKHNESDIIGTASMSMQIIK